MTSSMTISDISFSSVREICDLVIKKDIDTINSTKFSDIDRRIATEVVPVELSLWYFKRKNLDAKIQEWDKTGDGRTEAFFSYLDVEMVQFLATETRHELLPLFFSTCLQNEHSIFITDKEIRDHLLKTFTKLAAWDGKTIDDLKSDYIKEDNLLKLMPITQFIWANEQDRFDYVQKYSEINWHNDEYVSPEEIRRLEKIDELKSLPDGYASSFEPEVNLKNTLKRIWYGLRIGLVCLAIYYIGKTILQYL